MNDANLRVLLAAVEDEYGVAETVLQPMLVRVTSFNPRQGTLKERDNIKPFYGANKQLYMGTYGTINIEFDLTPSGTAGTMPLYSPLLRCCGRSVTEGSDPDEVTVELVTRDHESATIAFHMDGELHTFVGARGRGGITINGDDHLVFQAEIWGLTVPPTDAALPTPDFTNYLEPLPITDGNSTFALHGFSGVLNQMELTDGYNLFHRDVPGVREIALRNRAPGGTLQVDLPDITEKDFHDVIAKHQTGALTFTLGSTAGNIVEISRPKVQLINPTLPEVDGVTQLNATMIALANSDAGDDEEVVTFK